MYRVTEKQEIKKMLEIGKTPREYYGLDNKGQSKVDVAEEDVALSETLLRKEDSTGVEVKLIKGENFEQVKVSSPAGTVPDPRVAGPAIYFDSRLDSQP